MFIVSLLVILLRVGFGLAPVAMSVWEWARVNDAVLMHCVTLICGVVLLSRFWGHVHSLWVYLAEYIRRYRTGVQRPATDGDRGREPRSAPMATRK